MPKKKSLVQEVKEKISCGYLSICYLDEVGDELLMECRNLKHGLTMWCDYYESGKCKYHSLDVDDTILDYHFDPTHPDYDPL